MSWLKLTVGVSRESADAVSDRLSEMGAAAVTLTSDTAGPDGEEVLLEPLPGEQPLWREIVLEALLPPDTAIAALRDAVEACGGRLLDAGFLAEDDWLSRWRAHAARACFAGRLWLMPRDEPFEAPPGTDPVVLRLDPGLAFGSGSHPTTRLCLEGLAGLDLRGCRVLDYGCGSGVLGVAAALLGAAEVVAVDHDPQALLATRDNAAYNQLDDGRLAAVLPEDLAPPGTPPRTGRIGGTFDVVVANILANPLVDLAPELTARLRPGNGRLMLSGLLAEQAGMIREAYTEVEFEAPVAEAEWIRLDGRRRD